MNFIPTITTSIYFTFFATLISCLCWSCSSEENYAENITCHDSNNYTEASFKEDIIGIWGWIEMECEQSNISTNYDGLVLEFTETELIIFENGIETARSIYEISLMDNGEFWILDEGNFPVTGRANYICKNELVIEGSLSLSCIALYGK